MGKQSSKIMSIFDDKQNHGASKRQYQILYNNIKQKDMKIRQLQQYSQTIRKDTEINLRQRQNYFAQIFKEKIQISNSQFQQLQKNHFQQKNKIQNDYAQRISQISNKLTQMLKQKQDLEQKKQDIIYQTDPQLQKQLEQIKRTNKQQLLQLKKLNDPEKIKQAKEAQFKNYLEFLRKKNWPQKSQNEKQKNYTVVGDISSGKSSCLNYFFGLKQKTGIDETTMQAKIVFKKDNICIWDTPGICEQFDIMDLKNLQLFAKAHKVFVLFDKSLKCCKECLQVMAAVRKNKDLYVIRTMCDKFESQAEFQKAINKDKQLLVQWNLGDVPLLSISTMKDLMFEDNLLVKSMFQK